MRIDDPSTLTQTIPAVKAAIESIRSAIEIVKDIRSLGGGTEQQKKTIDQAITVASSATAIAEAEIAKALGYELCRCEFPPTPMLTVGYWTGDFDDHRRADPVYECPKCGFDTAGPWGYERTAPWKSKPNLGGF